MAFTCSGESCRSNYDHHNNCNSSAIASNLTIYKRNLGATFHRYYPGSPLQIHSVKYSYFTQKLHAYSENQDSLLSISLLMMKMSFVTYPLNLRAIFSYGTFTYSSYLPTQIKIVVSFLWTHLSYISPYNLSIQLNAFVVTHLFCIIYMLTVLWYFLCLRLFTVVLIPICYQFYWAYYVHCFFTTF